MAQPLRSLGGQSSSGTCLTLRSSNKLQGRPISKLGNQNEISMAQSIEYNLKQQKSDLDFLEGSLWKELA